MKKLIISDLEKAYKEHDMAQVISKDGTKIVYDKVGKGTPVVLVEGATATRSSFEELANLLASDFTVYYYDRRGRGDSSDTLPYSVEKEIEDIEALIDEAGGTAYLYGISSGGALALEAFRIHTWLMPCLLLPFRLFRCNLENLLRFLSSWPLR